jgi:hypothetical protein
MQKSLERWVISFATDSICITKKLDIDSDEIGSLEIIHNKQEIIHIL